MRCRSWEEQDVGLTGLVGNCLVCSRALGCRNRGKGILGRVRALEPATGDGSDWLA